MTDPGAALEDHARRAAPAVHDRGGLAAAPDLGHGHRQPGPHRRRQAGGLPHEPGRQQAPERSSTAPTGPDYHGHRADAWARPPRRPYAGGDSLPSTAWHPRVRGRQQRRLHGPVRHQGQRRGDAGLRRQGPEQPAHRPGPTARSSRVPRRPASSSFARGRGAAVVDLNLDGLLDIVEVTARENVELWRNVGLGRRRERRRRWVTGLALRLDQPGAEPRRDRRLDRGPDRRPDHPAAS